MRFKITAITAAIIGLVFASSVSFSADCKKNDKCMEYAGKGESFFNDEKYAKAIAFFLKAIEIDDKYVRGMAYVGISYCKMEDKENAKKYFDRVIEIAPKSDEAKISKKWLPKCTPAEEPQEEKNTKEKKPQNDENICLGKKATDIWSETAKNNGWGYGWNNEADIQTITDGDFATGLTSGYGKWGKNTLAKNIQLALQAASQSGLGIPGLRIDLGESHKISKITVGRPSQYSSEGDGGHQMIMSVQVSQDGTTWINMVVPFYVAPNQSISFASDKLLYADSIKFIQINFHSMGFYKWKKNNDSQMGISEVQCFQDASE